MILVWVASFALVAIVVEWLCRFSLRNILRRYSNMPNSRTIFSVNERLRRWLPAEVEYAVNREGERGLPLPKVGRYYRVLLSGGSAAECCFLPWKDSVGGHLETLLNQPGARASLGVEAAHVGLVAHSQLDAYGIAFILKNILPFYRSLDTVLLVTGLSDVLLWLEAGAPDGAAAPSVDKSAEWLLNYPEMKFRFKRPATLILLRRLWTYCFGSTTKRENAGRHVSKEMEARSRARPHVHVVSDPSVMVQAYKQNLRNAVDVAQRYAKRVILIRQYWFDKIEPTSQEDTLLWEGRLGHPKAPGPPAFIERVQMLDLFRLIGQATQETATECGVECVSLVDNLELREGIFYDDSHYAPEGGRQTAAVLAKAILRCV
jgi:hypothetical protein